MIHLHRIYDHETAPAGQQFLVERLWPRGIRKDALKLAGWTKDAAPSSTLRRWFAHDVTKWPEFQKRYFAELESRPDAWQTLLLTASRGPVVFLYSSRDTIHNNAVALKSFIESKLSSR
jgi:uncharacterized protein YeaO (DUF488 family)